VCLGYNTLQPFATPSSVQVKREQKIDIIAQQVHWEAFEHLEIYQCRVTSFVPKKDFFMDLDFIFLKACEKFECQNGILVLSSSARFCNIISSQFGSHGISSQAEP
jgi:hypothetical protein